MAKQIAPTPVLTGRSARQFECKVSQGLQTKSRPVPAPRAPEAIKIILRDAAARKK